MEPLGDWNAKIGFGSGVVQGLRRALGTRIVLLFGSRTQEPPKGFHIDLRHSAESTVLAVHEGEYPQPTYQLSIAPGITRVRQEFGSNDEMLVALDDYKVVHSVDTANTKGHVSIHIAHGPKENPNSITLLINLPEGSKWHYCADQPMVLASPWPHQGPLKSHGTPDSVSSQPDLKNSADSFEATTGISSTAEIGNAPFSEGLFQAGTPANEAATDGNNVCEEKVEQPTWVNQGASPVTNLNPAPGISSGIALDPEAELGTTINTNDIATNGTDDEPAESSDFTFFTAEEIAEINTRSLAEEAKTSPPRSLESEATGNTP